MNQLLEYFCIIPLISIVLIGSIQIYNEMVGSVKPKPENPFLESQKRVQLIFALLFALYALPWLAVIVRSTFHQHWSYLWIHIPMWIACLLMWIFTIYLKMRSRKLRQVLKELNDQSLIGEES